MSISAEQMTDILDIENIWRHPLEKWLQILPWILFVAGLVLLLFFLFRFYKKIKLKKKEDNLRSDERFKRDIERLIKQKFIERHDYRRFYFFLTEIFRRYLTERYDYPAMDKTTGEIERDFLIPSNLDVALKDKVFIFLRDSDLIKFAELIPDEQKPLQDVRYLQEFVEKTKSIVNKK